MPVKDFQKKVVASCFDTKKLEERAAKTGQSQRKDGRLYIHRWLEGEKGKKGTLRGAHEAASNLLEKLPWLKLSPLYSSLDLYCINRTMGLICFTHKTFKRSAAPSQHDPFN